MREGIVYFGLLLAIWRKMGRNGLGAAQTVTVTAAQDADHTNDTAVPPERSCRTPACTSVQLGCGGTNPMGGNSHL